MSPYLNINELDQHHRKIGGHNTVRNEERKMKDLVKRFNDEEELYEDDDWMAG